MVRTSVECEDELSEIEGFWRAMEVEVQDMISTDKIYNQKKLDGYAGELKQLRDVYKELRNKSNIIAQKHDATSIKRKALLDANDRLDKSTKSLQKSQFSINDSEQVGYVIIADLENQREKLIGAGANVDETKGITYNARRVLNQISNRVLMQKLSLLALILTLFCVIWLLLYYGILSRKK
jgi:Snare region anchored in the vesicle membrane C-terminus